LGTLRQKTITKPIFNWAKKAMPSLSETERDALEAGDTWWDGELFTGNPDWEMLRNTPQSELTKEEQVFIDGPLEELCGLIDDWKIVWETGDMEQKVWDFLRENKLFGMIIPKKYGGLEFSAFAHSEIVKKITTRSTVAAVTTMVPNSLGPGELLLQFGTEDQKDYWLPRLADGREIPCFGLTSEEAGSDAGAMVDKGVICEDEYNGEKVLGIRLNWSKRYITLGPVATVLGLAFKCYDPDHLLGDQEDLGISVALVPTDLPGVEIGRRHLPAFQMFQNGPNSGKDVFIPFENVIGGKPQLGRGWAMLMSALAAGRGISLPALSAAGTTLTARTSGNYARVRQQFGVPISKFEGVQAPLADLAGRAYKLDAARYLTCSALDQGHKPSVIAAIMKYHMTSALRESVTDAMDIHAGKAVMDGPLNYLGSLNRAVPVAITVEGANIMTRSLMIFGQGAIRCHPHLLDEILALEKDDQSEALEEFDNAFWKHVGHSVKTVFRSIGRSWFGTGSSPDEPDLRRYYKCMSRYAAALAIASDMSLLILGGKLKFKEMLSARLGDVLSELYMLSAVLKRWEDEGRHSEDLPLVQYNMKKGFVAIETALDEVYNNFPNKLVAWFLRAITLPFGKSQTLPSDALRRQCADLITSANSTRDRLSQGMYLCDENGSEGISRLERAFNLTLEAAPAETKLRDANYSDPDEALKESAITQVEHDLIVRAREASALVIEVDDFAADDFVRYGCPPEDREPEEPVRDYLKRTSSKFASAAE